MSIHRWSGNLIDARQAYMAAAGNFAREARAERICAGITQASVATAAGISAQYLCDIERGRRVPSVDVTRKIAEAIES